MRSAGEERSLQFVRLQASGGAVDRIYRIASSGESRPLGKVEIDCRKAARRAQRQRDGASQFRTFDRIYKIAGF